MCILLSDVVSSSLKEAERSLACAEKMTTETKEKPQKNKVFILSRFDIVAEQQSPVVLLRDLIIIEHSMGSLNTH